jgi:hypothetical protein
MATETHERIVDRVMERYKHRGVSKANFMRAITPLVRIDISDCRVIPDAYLIDLELRVVICYECVYSSAITEPKVAKYRKLSAALGVNSFVLIVKYVDVNGAESPSTETQASSRDINAAIIGLLSFKKGPCEDSGGPL